MLHRRHFLTIAAGSAAGAVLLPRLAAAQATPSAATDMNELGPENEAIAQRAGLWDVTETVRDAPDASSPILAHRLPDVQSRGGCLGVRLDGHPGPGRDHAGLELRPR